MNILDAIYNRRAVRSYTGEAIGEAFIARLIHAATQAPSAIDAQPWSFVVIRDRERLAAIARDARRYLLTSIPDDSPKARLKALVGAADFDMFYGAPALIIICATSAEADATQDCALAAENLMLAARALDLGSCWIGLAKPWLNQPAVKAELGIDQISTVVAPIVIGHPSAWPHPPGRHEPHIRWIGA